MFKLRTLCSSTAAKCSAAALAVYCYATAGIASAEPVAIPLQEIELDWATFAGTLAASIAAVVAVAVGIGIGVWMVRLVYRIFKSFARG